jgi:hypothetical protein
MGLKIKINPLFKTLVFLMSTAMAILVVLLASMAIFHYYDIHEIILTFAVLKKYAEYAGFVAVILAVSAIVASFLDPL